MPDASDAPANPAERYQRSTKKLKRAKDAEERWRSLGDAAMSALWVGRVAVSRKYAEELRSLTPDYEGHWNYGNAIQDYNIALGSVALSTGNVGSAKRFLLAAGRTPGSPQLISFGPNMSLAKALLMASERKAVISYFDLCQNFWPREKLSVWRVEVERGEIPDFGANMTY